MHVDSHPEAAATTTATAPTSSQALRLLTGCGGGGTICTTFIPPPILFAYFTGYVPVSRAPVHEHRDVHGVRATASARNSAEYLWVPNGNY